MLGDNLKIFVHGLPLDCEEHSLKDFLEAVCDLPGVVTKVSIPFKKSFAFVTLSSPVAVKCLLGNTLLYCDGVGQVYHVQARPYVRKPFRNFQDCKPKKTEHAPSKVKMEPKPLKYKPPEHVIQLSPDFSLLSHTKPKKRRKRKGDDPFVWLGDVGTTSFRKRPKHKKKKKKASKLEFHKFHSETLQFRNVNPAKDPTIANTDDSNAPPKEAVNSLVQENDHELGKANEKIPAEEEQKCSSTISSPLQVIVDHDYLGPLCLQFTGLPSVADVKSEIMERHGLPVKNQRVYCGDKMLCDTFLLRPLLNKIDECLTLTLSVGSLKGGAPPKKAPDEGASGGTENLSSSEQDVCPGKTTNEGATGGKLDSSAVEKQGKEASN